MSTTLVSANLPELTLLHRGKVRDVFELPPVDGQSRLLMVATDRLSAFDVVLPDPIPGKGEVLCQMSNFWFDKTAHLIPNHLLAHALDDVLPASAEIDVYRNRSVITKKLKPLPVEAIARGYLIGSGWKDYQRTGRISGIRLPDAMQQAQQLDKPIFTPSTKAAVGDHDESIDFDTLVKKIGSELAEQVRDITLRLYEFAAHYAAEKGLILADTKFEFGLDDNGRLTLMDEALTPDSSRYWSAADYQVGISPPSYDKQFVRDYLETLDWDKTPPAPHLPEDIVRRTRAKYVDALIALTGTSLD